MLFWLQAPRGGSREDHKALKARQGGTAQRVPCQPPQSWPFCQEPSRLARGHERVPTDRAQGGRALSPWGQPQGGDHQPCPDTRHTGGDLGPALSPQVPAGMGTASAKQGIHSRRQTAVVTTIGSLFSERRPGRPEGGQRGQQGGQHRGCLQSPGGRISGLWGTLETPKSQQRPARSPGLTRRGGQSTGV